jgi:hydroxyacylglutathione hydrolase
MRVHSVACLADNYAYVLDDGRGGAVVVDPSAAAPVEAVLRRHGLALQALWLTHHHWDHVGGVEALCDAHPGLTVVGSRYDAAHARIARQTVGLAGGDRLSFGAAPVALFDIPGHTLGAIAYLVDGCLFSGDTLFLAGCGRVFEGTMPMMQASLATLRALDPGTRVYCGHEYTMANLKFASTVEPANLQVRARLEAAEAARARGEATVPGTLAEDIAVNPFLRWDAPAVIAYARDHGARADDPASVFGAVRCAKDAFKSS